MGTLWRKEILETLLAIRKSVPFKILPRAHLALALSTDKMIGAPIFVQRRYKFPLDGILAARAKRLIALGLLLALVLCLRAHSPRLKFNPISGTSKMNSNVSKNK
jgi:hypothetical protein